MRQDQAWAALRLALLLLGLVSLILGIAGGLARLTPLPVSINALAFHGPLMVSAAFGTLIALERAATFARLSTYPAPLCTAVGGLLLLAGFHGEGFALMTLGSALFTAASALALRRRASLTAATLLGAAVAWLFGNLAVFLGVAAVPWWVAFFALAIAAGRVELSPPVEAAPRTAFVVLAAALFAAPLEPRFLGVVLALLALWLVAFDPARRTLRQGKLARYGALSLLAGDFWLAAGGVLLALETAYDAALHAVFVGAVFSTLFGRAPAILHGLLGVRLPYSAALYAPLVLLHASLVMRMFVATEWGGWGNAAALALFLLTAAALALRGRAGG